MESDSHNIEKWFLNITKLWAHWVFSWSSSQIALFIVSQSQVNIFLDSTLCGMKISFFHSISCSFDDNFLHTMLVVKENFSQRYINDNENKWRFCLTYQRRFPFRFLGIFGLLRNILKRFCCWRSSKTSKNLLSNSWGNLKVFLVDLSNDN